MQPLGEVGPAAGRDGAGRFTAGNRAALIVGERSSAFWQAQQSARREIERAVLQDAGAADDDAPRALQLAAEGIAQATLLRDAAFQRLIESGGPMTSAGRTRRAFTVWLAASDRLERYIKLVGLSRAPKPAMSFIDAVRQAAQANDRGEGGE